MGGCCSSRDPERDARSRSMGNRNSRQGQSEDKPPQLAPAAVPRLIEDTRLTVTQRECLKQLWEERGMQVALSQASADRLQYALTNGKQELVSLHQLLQMDLTLADEPAANEMVRNVPAMVADQSCELLSVNTAISEARELLGLGSWMMEIGDYEQLVMLSFLELADVTKVMRVSRHFAGLIRGEAFWQERCLQDLSIAVVPQGLSGFHEAYRNSANLQQSVGELIEVLDSFNIWSVARILCVLSSDVFLIQFEGWNTNWQLWLHRSLDRARVRGLGADCPGLGSAGACSRVDFSQMQQQAEAGVLSALKQKSARSSHEVETVEVPCGWSTSGCRCGPKAVVPHCYGPDSGDFPTTAKEWVTAAHAKNTKQGSKTLKDAASWTDPFDSSVVVTGWVRDSGRSIQAAVPVPAKVLGNADAWARRQHDALMQCDWRDVNGACELLRKSGVEREPLPLSLRSARGRSDPTSQPVKEILARMRTPQHLFSSWEQGASTIGALEVGNDVVLVDYVSGLQYFPKPGDLTLMAKTDGGSWIRVRDSGGIFNVDFV